MLFRQLFDARSSTYTYLLADRATGDAVLIDPVYEQAARDAALVRELDLKLIATLETHVHADHVTAASRLKAMCGSKTIVSERSGAEGADRYVRAGDVIEVGGLKLEVRETPGHTSGCVSYVSSDRAFVFTGDALLIRAAGRTDFQEGDARTLYRAVHEQLFSLPDSCVVCPAHDYQGRSTSSIGEERRLNPRLGGERSEGDFIGYMANLGLPHPKQIDVALPANKQMGRHQGAPEPPPAGEWGAAVRTFAGVLEVAPEWVHEHRRELTVIDVREPSEWSGELGHIEGAELLPIGELRARLDSLPRDRPIVAVCRSGGRSAQATLILESAGFQRVANIEGGMIRWRALGLPAAAGQT
jgi:glyoxylase-like metal-dependent hydrolase (beta-lactamase superfamily II)/rhodanese-related sulfurtransferase